MSIKHEQKTAVSPGKPGSEVYPESPLGKSEKGIAKATEPAETTKSYEKLQLKTANVH